MGPFLIIPVHSSARGRLDAFLRFYNHERFHQGYRVRCRGLAANAVALVEALVVVEAQKGVETASRAGMYWNDQERSHWIASPTRPLPCEPTSRRRTLRRNEVNKVGSTPPCPSRARHPPGAATPTSPTQ